METSFFTLSAPNGITVEICTLGASITRLLLPDRHGLPQNVVLTLADKADYGKNPFYAGATLGPNAGRISNARLYIDGTAYQLTANDGPHNLHGGPGCLSFHNWTLKNLWQDSLESGILLEATLPDKQDGFPGNRSVQAAYTLTSTGLFHIRYTAATDRPTYLNLSNHSYFNLSGDFTKDVRSEQLQINAEYYVANDREHLPEAILPTPKTPFDYRCPHTLQEQMLAYPTDRQLQNANGYNNAFCLNHSSGKADAVLYDSESGRKLELFTDAPCLVLYSGGYLSGGPKIETLNHRITPPLSSCALALEAQDFPNAPNSPLFPCTLLSPGKTAERNITFRFTL